MEYAAAAPAVHHVFQTIQMHQARAALEIPNVPTGTVEAVAQVVFLMVLRQKERVAPGLGAMEYAVPVRAADHVFQIIQMQQARAALEIPNVPTDTAESVALAAFLMALHLKGSVAQGYVAPQECAVVAANHAHAMEVLSAQAGQTTS
jgi:hypothetical protein